MAFASRLIGHNAASADGADMLWLGIVRPAILLMTSHATSIARMTPPRDIRRCHAMYASSLRRHAIRQHFAITAALSMPRFFIRRLMRGYGQQDADDTPRFRAGRRRFTHDAASFLMRSSSKMMIYLQLTRASMVTAAFSSRPQSADFMPGITTRYAMPSHRRAHYATEIDRGHQLGHAPPSRFMRADMPPASARARASAAYHARRAADGFWARRRR